MNHTYDVLGLDVWGHSPDECGAEYDCPCVKAGKHDSGRCECSFEVNSSYKVGTIELADDATDLDTLRTLQAAGYLSDALAPDDVKFEWSDEHFGEVILASDGKYLLNLTRPWED